MERGAPAYRSHGTDVPSFMLLGKCISFAPPLLPPTRRYVGDAEMAVCYEYTTAYYLAYNFPSMYVLPLGPLFVFAE